jgi:hypothetical protein
MKDSDKLEIAEHLIMFVDSTGKLSRIEKPYDYLRGQFEDEDKVLIESGIGGLGGGIDYITNGTKIKERSGL